MSEPVIIRLTYGQMTMAAHIGVAKNASNILKNVEPKYGASKDEDTWEKNINGACAEVAVARYTNLFWCGTLNEFGAPDVGGLIDVRAITNARHKLILHDSDGDDVPFVSVLCKPPVFTLRGWIFAKEGKIREKYWRDDDGVDSPAYFVSSDILRPMPELLEWIKERR